MSDKTFTSTVPTFNNAARIDYDLVCGAFGPLKGSKETTSRRQIATTYYYQSSPEPKSAKFPGAFSHQFDAELLLLDWLAEQIKNLKLDDGWTAVGPKGAKLKEPKTEDQEQDTYEYRASRTMGVVTITSDLGPCHSCKDVIKVFRNEFPKVKVVIKYRKPAGPTYSMQDAGQGLWGVYGYGSSELDDLVWDGSAWVKTYPPKEDSKSK